MDHPDERLGEYQDRVVRQCEAEDPRAGRWVEVVLEQALQSLERILSTVPVDRNITSDHLIVELDRLTALRGYPAVLRCGNGPELACAAVADWAGERTGLHCIPPGQPGFAFDGALRDIARTRDVASARWVAKTLQYPTTNPRLSGPAWPWGLALRPILLAAAGAVTAVLGIRFLGRRRRGGFRGGDRAAPPDTSSNVEPSST